MGQQLGNAVLYFPVFGETCVVEHTLVLAMPVMLARKGWTGGLRGSNPRHVSTVTCVACPPLAFTPLRALNSAPHWPVCTWDRKWLYRVRLPHQRTGPTAYPAEGSTCTVDGRSVCTDEGMSCPTVHRTVHTDAVQCVPKVCQYVPRTQHAWICLAKFSMYGAVLRTYHSHSVGTSSLSMLTTAP
jgi:hypothetical protein